MYNVFDTSSDVATMFVITFTDIADGLSLQQR